MNDAPVDQSSTRASLEPRFHAPGDLVANNLSTSGAQATSTVSAGVNGQKRVVTAFSFTMVAAGNPGVGVTTIGCAIIDGATAGTTFLWREILVCTTTGGTLFRDGLNLIGTANTALTIECSAGVSNAIQAVNMSYHTLSGTGA